MEDILSAILIAHGDLCPRCYVLDGAAPQLSSLEENVRIFITAMIDEAHHEVETGPVRGL